MRHAGWLLVLLVFLGALFWPYLALFGVFMFIVMIVSAIVGRRK